jgi:hypothetical protein
MAILYIYLTCWRIKLVFYERQQLHDEWDPRLEISTAELIEGRLTVSLEPER